MKNKIFQKLEESPEYKKGTRQTPKKINFSKNVLFYSKSQKG
jgi:hypothetical protein